MEPRAAALLLACLSVKLCPGADATGLWTVVHAKQRPSLSASASSAAFSSLLAMHDKNNPAGGGHKNVKESIWELGREMCKDRPEHPLCKQFMDDEARENDLTPQPASLESGSGSGSAAKPDVAQQPAAVPPAPSVPAESPSLEVSSTGGVGPAPAPAQMQEQVSREQAQAESEAQGVAGPAVVESALPAPSPPAASAGLQPAAQAKAAPSRESGAAASGAAAPTTPCPPCPPAPARCDTSKEGARLGHRRHLDGKTQAGDWQEEYPTRERPPPSPPEMKNIVFRSRAKRATAAARAGLALWAVAAVLTMLAA